VVLNTAYSYARLSVTFPSQGGTVEFLNQGFGVGLLAGALGCGAALVILIWQRARVNPAEIWVLVVMAAMAVGIEAAYRALTGRTLAPTFRAHR
jgi:amino acid transporter